MKKLFLIFGMCAATTILTAQDTIRFTWKGGVNKRFIIGCTGGSQITVKWGDATPDTIIADPGYMPTVYHSYNDTNNYEVTIIGDPSIPLFVFGTLNCSMSQISDLKLSNNSTLQYLDCSSNQLTNLVLGSNLQTLYCWGNQLPLSDLYAASLLVSNRNNKRLGHQFLPIR